MDIREAHITPAKPIRQLRVVNPHQVQDGRMEVVHFHLVLDGVITPVIRGAIRHSTLDSTTSHPHREAVRVMIAAIATLCHRRSTKLTTPNHQSVLQHPAGLEILE